MGCVNSQFHCPAGCLDQAGLASGDELLSSDIDQGDSSGSSPPGPPPLLTGQLAPRRRGCQSCEEEDAVATGQLVRSQGEPVLALGHGQQAAGTSAQSEALLSLGSGAAPLGQCSVLPRSAASREEMQRLLQGLAPSPPGELCSPLASPPFSQNDMCLVFVAFATWAVRTSDLHTPDAWKTGVGLWGQREFVPRSQKEGLPCSASPGPLGRRCARGEEVCAGGTGSPQLCFSPADRLPPHCSVLLALSYPLRTESCGQKGMTGRSQHQETLCFSFSLAGQPWHHLCHPLLLQACEVWAHSQPQL
ncbi:uncharacterized protein LOC143640185 isoform X2 [Callospermophilus lateralis]|uniref:uncharacterized protein LOC143640185 isoform X2 n=1 Tax=Callospermophilus lateralis TaxID=76772 RepID=UPI004053FC77